MADLVGSPDSLDAEEITEKTTAPVHGFRSQVSSLAMAYLSSMYFSANRYHPLAPGVSPGRVKNF